MLFATNGQKWVGCAAAMMIGGLVLGSGRTLPAQELLNEEPNVIATDDEFGAVDVEVERAEAIETDAVDAPEEAPPAPAPESIDSAQRYDVQQDAKQHQQPGELGVRIENADGVVVRGVIVGAAGNKAGLRPGDRIIAIDGQAIQSVSDVHDVFRSKMAGDTCSIEVQRYGETITLSAVLEPRVGYYNQASVVAGETGDYGAEPVRYRSRRYYQPRYSYRPYSDDYGPRYRRPLTSGPFYRSYPPRYYGRYYYGTPRSGYYGRAWGNGGLRLGPLNIWW